MDGSCIDDISTTTDSTSTAHPPPPPPEKLCRVGSGTSVVIDSDFGGGEADSGRKLPSSRFKGVVPQPNGRWGAQIYEKHQRVWLGTFNEEKQAAVAYDTAVQRFRGRDAVTNFKSLSENDDMAEIAFLSSQSKAEIVDMLRKHTYNDELEQNRRNSRGVIIGRSGPTYGPIKTREHLFEKAVTPSDVGKLNRLVIPKHHAEKHFPFSNETISKGVLLNFEDVGGKVWRFRYSYWNSSQSYVLTKGWSRFVKEKGLLAGDVVSFKRSTGLDKQLYIEWKSKGRIGNGTNNGVSSSVGIRLFGVDILEESNANGGRKRLREMEVFGLESSKKEKKVFDFL